MSKSRVNKPLTYEERIVIQKHLSKGLSCAEIARRIGRSKNGVVTEVRKTGNPYNAKERQKEVDRIQHEKHQKIVERNRINASSPKIRQRIDNLEMQIEILHDCIKEIMNRDK